MRFLRSALRFASAFSLLTASSTADTPPGSSDGCNASPSVCEHHPCASRAPRSPRTSTASGASLCTVAPTDTTTPPERFAVTRTASLGSPTEAGRGPARQNGDGGRSSSA